MNVTLASIVYVAAMVLANLSVAIFGPSVTAINALVFIGLDLALRDWLHVKVSRTAMLSLVLLTGLLTLSLNPAADRIAIASAASFLVAASLDLAIFNVVRGSWFRRSNLSNIVGAVADSVVFPTLAFGAVMPGIIAGQIAAKVVGGAFFALIISRVGKVR